MTVGVPQRRRFRETWISGTMTEPGRSVEFAGTVQLKSTLASSER